MNLKSSIQKTFYRKSLKKKVKKNIATVPMNMSKASSVAMLLDITDGIDSPFNQAALKYRDQLEKKGKKVELLAYTNDVKVPEALGFDCFCRKDLNWALVPKGPLTNSFLSKAFDILFVFYKNESDALDFLAQTSDSKLVAGYYDENKKDFIHLMVHNEKADFARAVDQLDNLLQKINN